MAQLLVFAFLYFYAFQATLGSQLRTAYEPPLVVVDLEADVADRWKPAIMAVLNKHAFTDSFLPVFASHNASLFVNITNDQYATLAASLEQHYPAQAAELHGISQAFQELGHTVTFTYLAGWVWFHELAHSDAAAPELRDMQGKSCHAFRAGCSQVWQ